MNNDLISREALKMNEPHYDEEGYRIFYESEIDNAQPVEPFEPDYVGTERLKARQRGYEEGYHNGMKIGKTLNPKIKQGKWRLTLTGDVICSVCKLPRRDTRSNHIQFCNHCGAAMIGENTDS